MVALFQHSARNGAVLLTLAAACASPVERTLGYSTDGPNRAGVLLTARGLVAANDLGAVALIGEDSRPIWRLAVCREVVARPAVVGDTLVVACTGGDWIGLALADGKELWRTALKRNFSTALTNDGQRAFGVDADGTVWAVLAASGTVAWKRAPPELKPSQQKRTFAAPTVWSGFMMASLSEAGLYALDPVTGQVHFRVPTRGLTGLLPLGDRLLVLWPSGKLGSLKQDGAFAWTRELGAPALSGPALVNGLVWAGLEGNVLLGVAPEDGTERARFDLPAPALGHPTALEDGVVVATSGAEGRVLAFHVGHEKPWFTARVDSPVRTDTLTWDGQVVVAPIDGRVLGLKPRAAAKP